MLTWYALGLLAVVIVGCGWLWVLQHRAAARIIGLVVAIIAYSVARRILRLVGARRARLWVAQRDAAATAALMGTVMQSLFNR